MTTPDTRPVLAGAVTTLPPLHDVSVELAEGIATVTLERPDVRNVISDAPLVDELPAVAEWLNTEPAVRVAVLTGRGSAFSAGGNVRLMHERAGMFGGTTSEIADAYRRGIQRLLRAVLALEVPVIAAVNGAAIGAGLDLALACDLRVASRTAMFGETFVNLGLIPGDGGSWLLPQVVGFQRAAELAYTGRIIDAAEARALGIVLSLHEPDKLLPAAYEIARVIAAKPPTAMRYTKRLLARARVGTPFDQVLEEAAVLQATLHETPEHAEAVAKLIERKGR
jgi:enoyl-CoA hydratase/carnithine racemase